MQKEKKIDTIEKLARMINDEIVVRMTTKNDLTAMEKRLDERLLGIENRLAALENKVFVLENRILDAHERRIQALEMKLRA